MRTTSIGSGLLVLVLVAGCGEQGQDFGPAEARALIPEAASMDGRALDEIVRLRHMVVPEDLERAGGGSVSLSLAVLFFGPEFGLYGAEPDLVFDRGWRVTPEDLAVVWRPYVGSGGERRAKYPFASLILEEHIQGITCQRDGDKAQGTVAFAAPGHYRGKFEWKARRGARGWQIVEFRMPRARFRVFLDGEIWRAEDESRPGQPARPMSLPEAAVRTEELVRVGTIADHPADYIQVALTEDGSIISHPDHVTLEGLKLALDRMTEFLESREPGSTRHRSVVLRVHPRLPWEVVLWTIQTCAAPPLNAYRIHFAVQPEQGGPEGSMAAWIPRDSGTKEQPLAAATSPELSVMLFPDENEVDPGRAFQVIQEARREVGDSADTMAVSVAVPQPDRVAAGHVLRIVDLLYRAGFSHVRFQHWPLPEEAVAPGSPRSNWLREYVKSHPLPEPGFALQVGGRGLMGSPEDPRLPLPTLTKGLRAEPRALERGQVTALTRSIVQGAVRGSHVPKKGGPSPHSLRWLAAHQSQDGGWEAAGFDKWCDGEPNVGEKPDGLGDAANDVGVTGLALCAFLASGYTNRGDHEFAKIVRKGLAYLKNVQDPEGCFGPRTSTRYVYNHAIAALAMVEAYGLTLSPIFKGSAQKALDFIALARNPGLAWRYGVKPGENDTSVTGWMMLALKSAQLINEDAVKSGRPELLALQAAAFDGIKAWVDTMTDPATGRVGYLTPGSGPSRPGLLETAFPPEESESMTAVGLLARVFLHEDPETSLALRKGTALCVTRLPSWNTTAGSIDMTYWYFGLLAMVHLGGDGWSKWEKAADTSIVANQRMDGTYCDFKGSWDPVDPWGRNGGRVYSTALLSLCVQILYGRHHSVVSRGR